MNPAQTERLPAYFGSIIAEDVTDELDVSGIGRLLAVTPNDEVNSLAVLHFVEVFGRSEVYQLGSHASGHGYWSTIPRHLRGRILFGRDVSGVEIHELFDQGARVEVSHMGSDSAGIDFMPRPGGKSIPLFLIDAYGGLKVFTATDAPVIRPGCLVVHVPNSRVLTDVVADYCKAFEYIWNEIPVLVAFESGWRKSKRLIEEAAVRHATHLTDLAAESVRRAARRTLIHYTSVTPRVWTSVADSGVQLTAR